MSLVVAFFAAYLLVALKAFQQLNVVHHKVYWIPPVSYGMALGTAIEVLVIVDVGLIAVVPIGTGGWMGAITAMLIHRRLRGTQDRTPDL